MLCAFHLALHLFMAQVLQLCSLVFLQVTGAEVLLLRAVLHQLAFGSGLSSLFRRGFSQIKAAHMTPSIGFPNRRSWPLDLHQKAFGESLQSAGHGAPPWAKWNQKVSKRKSQIFFSFSYSLYFPATSATYMPSLRTASWS